MMELFVPFDETLVANGFPIDPRLEYEGIISKNDLDLLIWIYCDEMSYQEVADKLSISLSACKKQIQRAKQKFQQAIEEDEK